MKRGTKQLDAAIVELRRKWGDGRLESSGFAIDVTPRCLCDVHQPFWAEASLAKWVEYLKQNTPGSDLEPEVKRFVGAVREIFQEEFPEAYNHKFLN